MGAKIIVRGLSLGVLALLLNVAVAFAWVLFYSVAIAPGHDGAFYQAYAQRVAPLSAILAGAPLLFAAGWLAARGPRPDQAALIPAAAYMLLDLLLISIGGVWPPLWTLAASYLTKFAASYAGGRLAPRQQLLQ
jgi:hypothetical protein